MWLASLSLLNYFTTELEVKSTTTTTTTTTPRRQKKKNTTYVHFVSFRVDSQQDVVEDTRENQKQVEERGQAVEKLHEGRDLLWWREDVGSILDQTLGCHGRVQTSAVASLGDVDAHSMPSGDLLNWEHMLRLSCPRRKER